MSATLELSASARVGHSGLLVNPESKMWGRLRRLFYVV
jgi:hypothetical protein